MKPRPPANPAFPGSTGAISWLRLRETTGISTLPRRPGLAARWKAADRVVIAPSS
jgi:hypothetical protein